MLAYSYTRARDIDGDDRSLYLYLYLYLNWQNVLGTHHASAHGGSSDLIVKMLD